MRERICAIRLMEKVNKNPAAAEKLGIIVMNDPGEQANPGLKKAEC